jgi:hypothetical protein
MTASGLDLRRGALVGVAVMATLCGAALAAEDAPTPAPAPGDAGSAMIGTWEFSNADHDKVCHFNFRGDAVTGGSKLDIDRNCPSLFPSTKDIVAWSLDSYGALRLLDAHGNAVIELTEAESGIYDGFAPGEGRYVLQSAATAPMHTAEDMVGDWAIARGTGKPICVLTLVNDPPGGDTLALKVKPGCDAFVARFGPTGWRMNQGELVLLSARGQTWRFEQNDASTWQRVPEGANPVLLVRQ